MKEVPRGDRSLIPRKTAEKHWEPMLRKTGTSSRTAAVVRALEQGWIAEALVTRA